MALSNMNSLRVAAYERAALIAPNDERFKAKLRQLTSAH